MRDEKSDGAVIDIRPQVSGRSHWSSAGAGMWIGIDHLPALLSVPEAGAEPLAEAWRLQVES